MLSADSRQFVFLVTVSLCLFLAGCQGDLTVDLATEAPADVDIQQVVVGLRGLQFQNEDGDTESIEFTETESVDLLDYLSTDLLRLFTSEELPAGTYTGVRLLFDDDENDSFVIDSSGSEYPVEFSGGGYADIDYTVEDNSTSKEALLLTLDLRQSLRREDDTYTLTPILRSVPTSSAGSISGTVDVTCSDGSLDAGGAVYLFGSDDAEPDDRGSGNDEPYLTTSVSYSSSTGLYTYSLRYLPADDYTIALTCKGDEEDPESDDDLDFEISGIVELDKAETRTINFKD